MGSNNGRYYAGEAIFTGDSDAGWEAPYESEEPEGTELEAGESLTWAEQDGLTEFEAAYEDEEQVSESSHPGLFEAEPTEFEFAPEDGDESSGLSGENRADPVLEADLPDSLEIGEVILLDEADEADLAEMGGGGEVVLLGEETLADLGYEGFFEELDEDADLEEGAASGSALRARILWPALGFPAVIAPRDPPAASAFSGADATRCICVLLLSNRKNLSKAEAASGLRYLAWEARGRRHIRAGESGSFSEEELEVRNDEGQVPMLVVPGTQDADSQAEQISFGGNADGENGITVSLANYVREFYRKQGLKFLHEIRISERASGGLNDGCYQLFWNNLREGENAPSDEMQLLINRFARPRREDFLRSSQRVRESGKPAFLSWLLEEYEIEYGVYHEPYKSRNGLPRRRNEVLHPLFVQRKVERSVKIGHLTDLHVDTRANAYEANLKGKRHMNQSGRLENVFFNNWNTSFSKLYREAGQDCDVLLLTGDLIDYGRGHLAQTTTQMLGNDDHYLVDRNWFLFYYLLASGNAYQKPAYTILGNHDWRLNPYPPFSPGAPGPNLLIHNYRDFNKEQRTDILRTAHGPGHEKKFSYFTQAKGKLELALEKPWDVIKAGFRLFFQAQTVDEPHTPLETTVDSVAWYLLAINPFFDYSFSLPGGQQILMLDWAEDEDVLFPIVQDGKEWPYMLWQVEQATDPGPKTRRSLTKLQQRFVQQFLASRGKAKVIGIHAPPIGPYPDWNDHDLYWGRKIYQKKKGVRGPTHYATQRPDGSKEPWNGHPLFAISPSSDVSGVEADYGSLGEKRSWLIGELARHGSAVRLVLSGHIHRNGLYVAYTPGGDPQVSAVYGKMLIKGVVPQAVRGVKPPAVALTLKVASGPLYVNTTSAGPRGNSRPEGERHENVDPGYAQISLSNDGTIQSVEFRQLGAIEPDVRRAWQSQEQVVPSGFATTGSPG